MDLITGGTGIVGVHLLHAATSAGERVRALYRKNSDRSIVERVFSHYSGDARPLLERIEWVEGDLHDMVALTEAMEGIERVYHAAAMVSFAPRDRRALYQVNTTGTANVVNAALVQGVKRICHVSSTAAIGKAEPDVERHEELPWVSDRNTSPYAASKYAAELEIHRGIAEGLDAVMVNPCVIIGPGMSGRSTMTMIERLRKGTRFYPPGSNAVVDARDVAACMRLLMEKGPTGERYLLVGANVSYKELFGELAAAFGHKSPRHQLSPAMLRLAWRIEWLRTLFGGRPLVTRATVHSGIIGRRYSNAKVRAELKFEFRGLKEMVANVADFTSRSKPITSPHPSFFPAPR
jgi:dihydroflavonol-4-reductase